VAVGRIRKPHGVAGAVLVAVESDVPERFAVGRRLHLTPAAGGPSRPVVIAESQGHGDSCRLRFEGFTDRDACEALRGALLEVDRAEVPPAPPDTFYHFELEGCRCTDRQRGLLGEVIGVLEDGGGWILTVRTPGGKEVLVPFVKAFLVRVDTEGGEIELDLPEGLVDTCTSRS
jgi:16S rRNA processing protein RimM